MLDTSNDNEPWYSALWSGLVETMPTSSPWVEVPLAVLVAVLAVGIVAVSMVRN